MTAEDIFLFLSKLKKMLTLKGWQAFDPEEYHIYLQFEKGFGDPVAYMEYDPKIKASKGINPKLIPKLRFFLIKTGNSLYVSDLEENIF